jgi:hypothetical protein
VWIRCKKQKAEAVLYASLIHMPTWMCLLPDYLLGCLLPATHPHRLAV